MKQTLLSVLFFFLLISVVSYAQEYDDNNEQTIFNLNSLQQQPQSIFDDAQPISNSSWEWLHPTPQGNNLRWLKAWDANNWYAIGYAGTFIKTTDGGSSWTMSKNITGLSSTGFTQDLFGGYFFDLNTGFACGGGGKVVRTTDAGNTWTDVSPVGLTSFIYDFYFLDANIGYFCGTTSDDIWKTTDAGLTWAKLPTDVPTSTYCLYAFNQDTILAGSTTGNLIRTTDGGTTWTTIYVDGTSLIWDINFVDALNGFASGIDDAVGVTTDGGLTWAPATTGAPATSDFFDIDILSNSMQTLNEGFESATFPPAGWHAKNILGGVAWMRANGGHSGTGSAIIGWETTGGEDWLVTPQLNILTGDSLKFWARKFWNTTYAPDSLQIVVSTTDTSVASFTTVLAAYDVNAFPYGWTTQYAVDLSAFAGMSVYIAFRHFDTDGNGLYIDDVQVGEPVLSNIVTISGDPFNLYATTDMGSNWISLDILDPSQPWTGAFYQTEFITNDLFVSAGQNGMTNKVDLFAGTQTALTNWIKASTLYDVWAESKTGNVIAVGAPGISGSTYDQSIYSTDGGTTWSLSTINANPTEDFNDISMLNSTTGWVAGDEGGIWKTTDGGATWDSLANVGINLEEVFFVDANVGYVYGTSGSGWKSTDGGLTWTALATGFGTTLINSAYFVDANTGWIVGSSGKIFKTIDGGATSTALDAGVGTSTIYSINMVDANNGFLCTAAGKVRRTTDGGAVWDTVDVGSTSATLYDIEFRNLSHGTVVGSGSRVFTTTDGGENWDFESLGAGTFYGVSLENTSTDTAAAFVCGSSGAILKNSNVIIPVELVSFSASVTGNSVTLDWTTATEINNAGFQVERKSTNNWTVVANIDGNGTSTEPHSYSFVDAGLAVGDYNYRIKQLDFDGTYSYYNLAEVISIGAPADYNLTQNYPNPFNPTTKISYSVPVDGLVTLSIYNILGEKVVDIVNTTQKAGNYNVTFDARNLSSGMYLYRMESGEFVSVKKMMILK